MYLHMLSRSHAFPFTSRSDVAGRGLALFIIVNLIVNSKLMQFIFILIRISIESESRAVFHPFVVGALVSHCIYIQSACVIKLCQLRLDDKIRGCTSLNNS